MVKFNHDYIGREALEKMTANPSRKKVTLVLNDEDVTHAIGTMFQDGNRAKYIDFPSAGYATLVLATCFIR
jgi:glycine cleavage system aminomethyltransferase T